MAATIWKEQKLNKEDTVTKVIRYRNELNNTTVAISFSEFISKKLKEKNMTREDLAVALGYQAGEEARKKAQTLKHTISREGYTTNRDRIIAICLALEMSHPDTDKALYLYGMLPLSEFDTRELLLIQALTDHEGFLTTNRMLKEANLHPLEIAKTKQFPGPHIVLEPKDEFIRINSPLYSYGDFVGDSSLSGLYHPGSYSFDGKMTLKDNQGLVYTIEASDGGTYIVQREMPDGSFLGVNMYMSMAECMGGKFSKYFLELEDGIRKKVKEVLSIMDDTRNYVIRFDATVNNGKLDLFAETFNYDCPEYSEYYQMEKVSEKYCMTVTHESTFMRRHLGDYYSKYYSRPHNIDEVAKYTSTEEIQNSNSSAYWKKERIKHFQKMQDAMGKLISDLKSKTVLVNDPYSCVDDLYYDLAEIYKIQDLFSWKQSEADWHMAPVENSCIATTSDGSEVSITIDEMKRAFELGISSVDDIYLVKTLYGDLDGILI